MVSPCCHPGTPARVQNLNKSRDGNMQGYFINTEKQTQKDAKIFLLPSTTTVFMNCVVYASSSHILQT